MGGIFCWYVPCAYACSQGFVLDFFIKLFMESAHSFIEKWKLSIDTEFSEFVNEQQMQIEAENPLRVHYSSEAYVNGKAFFLAFKCISMEPMLPRVQ